MGRLVELAKLLGRINVAEVDLQNNNLDMRDISQLVASLQRNSTPTRLNLRSDHFERDSVGDVPVEAMMLPAGSSSAITKCIGTPRRFIRNL